MIDLPKQEEDVDTGIFVRIKRRGRWQSIDIGCMTVDERLAFFGPMESVELRKWAKGLSRWIRESVRSGDPE